MRSFSVESELSVVLPKFCTRNTVTKKKIVWTCENYGNCQNVNSPQVSCARIRLSSFQFTKGCCMSVKYDKWKSVFSNNHNYNLNESSAFKYVLSYTLRAKVRPVT